MSVCIISIDMASAVRTSNLVSCFPFSHSCTVHLDTIESFIYPTNTQLECSKILKFTLKFTGKLLLHVSVFHNHHQGVNICALLKL
jgi:hypothetical protein